MKILIAIAKVIEPYGIHNVKCFRRENLKDIPKDGISDIYLKTQDPKWERNVSVLNSELPKFMQHCHMPDSDKFLYWTSFTHKTAMKPCKDAPDWKLL